MCHLILALPFLAIPIFWLVPPSIAVPVYAIVALLSLFLYWLIRKSMMLRVQTGSEGLMGSEVEVLSKQDNNGAYTVRVQGELWTAHSTSILKSGERARIKAVDGMKLIVEPASKTKTPSRSAH